MAILNYSTSIAAEKTISEITRILTAAKADAIMLENKDGVPCAVSFRIRGPYGLMSFRLPANIDNVLRALCKDGKLPYRLRSKEQAGRVAWRVIKDWLEAQLAMIQAQLVTLEQVFLPYAQNASGETLYDSLAEGHFSGLALPSS
jgi:hypothetical protein